MNCIKCDNELEASVKFCGKCGAEQIKSQVKSEETKSEQKSFKLDMSKEGNRRSLMGIGFLILLKLLGALLGSYLLAGIILGVLFAIIDYSFKKSLTETGKIDKIESLKEKSNNLIKKPMIESEKVDRYKKLDRDYFKYFAKYAPFIVIIVLIVIIAIFINNKSGLKNTEQNQGKQGGKEFLFRKQTECMNICQAIYENHKKLLLTIGTVFSPKYTYNESKNACFYSGGWVDSLASNTKLVINCQTNEEVLTFETDRNGKVVRDCNTCVDSFEEYSRREKEYMENTN